MASRSSQRRNASRITPEHATALLEDGARIENPADDVLAAATALQGMGLIRAHFKDAGLDGYVS